MSRTLLSILGVLLVFALFTGCADLPTTPPETAGEQQDDQNGTNDPVVNGADTQDSLWGGGFWYRPFPDDWEGEQILYLKTVPQRRSSLYLINGDPDQELEQYQQLIKIVGFFSHDSLRYMVYSHVSGEDTLTTTITSNFRFFTDSATIGENRIPIFVLRHGDDEWAVRFFTDLGRIYLAEECWIAMRDWTHFCVPSPFTHPIPGGGSIVSRDTLSYGGDADTGFCFVEGTDLIEAEFATSYREPGERTHLNFVRACSYGNGEEPVSMDLIWTTDGGDTISIVGVNPVEWRMISQGEDAYLVWDQKEQDGQWLWIYPQPLFRLNQQDEDPPVDFRALFWEWVPPIQEGDMGVH